MSSSTTARALAVLLAATACGALAAPQEDDMNNHQRLPADPFGLAQERAQVRTQVHESATAATGNGTTHNTRPDDITAPAIRVLAVLQRKNQALTVLQIDGEAHRLRTGEALPGDQGKVFRIDIDSVELLCDGTHRVLPIGKARPATRPNNLQSRRRKS